MHAGYIPVPSPAASFSTPKSAQADHGGSQGRGMTGIDINEAAR
jgi:hypothetical protein